MARSRTCRALVALPPWPVVPLPLYHWPALAALGGPVSYGKPYLFGQRGPELFTPGMSGRIETNDTLRRLTADGATAVGATESRTVTNGGPVTFSPTFNITGGDPREVAGQI